MQHQAHVSDTRFIAGQKEATEQLRKAGWTASEKAKEYLATTVEQIRQGLLAGPVADPGLVITWSVTVDEDNASGLIRVAREGAGVIGRCQMIAMTTHGAGGLPRWVRGSITGRVLHASRLPPLACATTRHAGQGVPGLRPGSQRCESGAKGDHRFVL